MKEGLLGFYISTKSLNEEITVTIVQFFYELFQSEKKKALLPFPLIMMVDPTLDGNKLSIKILNLVSSFLKKIPMFCECSYSYAIQDYYKSGLDVLFYGQDHNDTLSIVSTN
jgi:hypothetical protein